MPARRGDVPTAIPERTDPLCEPSLTGARAELLADDLKTAPPTGLLLPALHDAGCDLALGAATSPRRGRGKGTFSVSACFSRRRRVSEAACFNIDNWL